MKIKNLTPHVVRIFDHQDKLILELPACKYPARIKTITSPAGMIKIEDCYNCCPQGRECRKQCYPLCMKGYIEIPLLEEVRKEIIGLPPESTEIIYIVSSIVRITMLDREDLVSPDMSKNSVDRDKEEILGVKRLRF